MPPIGRFAWDLCIEGNMVRQSGYEFPTPHAATVAAVRGLYAYFDSCGTLMDKDVGLSLCVVSEARTRGDEPVYEEYVHDFGLPWLIRDNGGETADRYTVYFTNGREYLGLGEAGDSYGWGEYSVPYGTPDVDEDRTWAHVGKKVAWAELPGRIRKAIRAKMDEALGYFERDNG